MINKSLRLAAVGAAGLLALTACGGSSGGGSGSSGGGSSSGAAASGGAGAASGGASGGASSGAGSATGGKVGVILPDTQSSARWESADRPLLTKAFQDAGIQADIQNAQGDKSKFTSIAQSMIQEKVNVLIITALDSASGAQVESQAKAAGIKVIDYDRLNLGGSADYYVSFDNVKVGQLQGEGLIKCVGNKPNARIIELDGSPTDNNATLFAQGGRAALQPKLSSGWKIVGRQAVPNWDNAQGGRIFQQLLTAAGNKIDGALVANDGLANAAITVLKSAGLQVPVTGQDATDQGLQNILAGDQCMTVYKPIKTEADAASKLAIALIKGQTPQTTGTVDDPQGKRKVPSVLGTPVAITKANVDVPIKDGFTTKAKVCTGKYAALCAKAGI